IKEMRPEYRDIHSQVLQDVLTRLERAVQAFFRRIKHGEAPGYPRFQGPHRYNSFTYKQFGTGVTLDTGFLILSKSSRKSGALPCAGPGRLRACPKPSRSRERRTAGTTVSPAPRCQ